MHQMRIGCSGWSYDDWKTPVYDNAPAGDWLRLYTERFPTVEVNTTFYRLPKLEMVAGWAERSPEDFLFAVKVSRYLTHVKRLGNVPDTIGPLLERLAPLVDAGKLGPLLWQLPPSLKRDDARLAAALEALPAGLRHAFEFRHESWFCPEVMALLREADAALVIGDDPRRPFQTHDRPASWTYVRFHRGRRGRRGNYSHTELAEWAEHIRRWAKDGDLYAYFDNDQEAFAVRNAEELTRLSRDGRRSGRS
jgi:uncharacterized protein YecE (DUF72 family)